MRLNLSKFFRATGLVLVLVAAGLVVNALHTAHEAGWLEAGQGGTIDLAWLVAPGSVQASLLTGMLGVQPHPVLIEVAGWLAYLIPVGCFVAWPHGRAVPRRLVAGLLAAAGVGFGVATAVLALLAPSAPAMPDATVATGPTGAVSAQVVSRSGDTAVVRTPRQSPAAYGPEPASSDLTVRRTGTDARSGVTADVYTATLTGTAAAREPARLEVDRVAELNGGRLPIGLDAAPGQTLPAHYLDVDRLTVWIEPHTGRVLDLSWREQVRVSVTAVGGAVLSLSRDVANASNRLPAGVVRDAAAQAAGALRELDRRNSLRTGARHCAVLAGLSLLAAAGSAGWAARKRRAQRRRRGKPADQPCGQLG